MTRNVQSLWVVGTPLVGQGLLHVCAKLCKLKVQVDSSYPGGNRCVLFWSQLPLQQLLEEPTLRKQLRHLRSRTRQIKT